MIAEYAAKIWATLFGPTGIIAAVALVIVAFIRAIPPMFKASKDANGSLDELQAKRITELERRMDLKDEVIASKDEDCDRKIEVLNGLVLMIARSQILVCADLRQINPGAESLAIAEAVLKRAFPIDRNTPEDLADLARRVERKP